MSPNRHRFRILLAALLVPALSTPGQGITVTDHPESSGSNPYLPSTDAPNYLTGWETIDQRFGLDGTPTQEAVTQSFTLDTPATLKSIFVSYNDSRAGGVIRVSIDFGNDGSTDFTQDVTLPALSPGADGTTPRTMPQNWLELDFSSENLSLPAGSSSFTVGGVSEEAGSSSFLFAPQYDIAPSGYAGGSMTLNFASTSGDLGFAVTGTPESVPDTDNDNLPDPWELSFPAIAGLPDLDGTLPAGGGPGPGTGDFDGDGLSDFDEFAQNSDPTDPADPISNLGAHLLAIDFNRNDTPGAPSQSDFRVVAGSATQADNLDSYTKNFGAIQIAIAQPDGTPFEFRGANGDSSRAIPGGDTSLSFLVADFIGTRKGHIDISIANLPAGTYFFHSHHLEPFTQSTGLGFAQGAAPATPNTIEARVGGTLMDSVQPTSLGAPGLGTTFIDNSQIPTLTFKITHDGASPLVINLASTESNGTDSFLFLNGFEIFAAPNP